MCVYKPLSLCEDGFPNSSKMNAAGLKIMMFLGDSVEV